MLHLHFSVVRPKSTRTSPYGAPRKLAGTAQFPESKDKLSRRSIAGTDEDDPLRSAPGKLAKNRRCKSFTG
jgi:hypothetical protein